jgi:hypothetical protein
MTADRDFQAPSSKLQVNWNIQVKTSETPYFFRPCVLFPPLTFAFGFGGDGSSAEP